MEFPFTVTSNSEEDTKAIANEFSKKIKNEQVIVLNGNLGSGKTYFIKNVLSNFNISDVNSPSFAIVNEYNGLIKAFHFDFFRIKNIRELYDIGWDDYLNDSEAVTFIEWGNLFPDALPAERIEVQISILGERIRKIEFAEYE